MGDAGRREDRPVTVAKTRAQDEILDRVSEAMWGVLQQGISTLDVDFVAYAAEHFDRLLDNASGPAFERALREAAGD